MDCFRCPLHDTLRIKHLTPMLTRMQGWEDSTMLRSLLFIFQEPKSLNRFAFWGGGACGQARTLVLLPTYCELLGR